MVAVMREGIGLFWFFPEDLIDQFFAYGSDTIGMIGREIGQCELHDRSDRFFNRDPLISIDDLTGEPAGGEAHDRFEQSVFEQGQGGGLFQY